jgi:hypothetical protein
MMVQAVDKQIDFAPADRATEVETRVLCRLGGRIHDFRVVVTASGLILRGQVRTYYAKPLAQHTVKEATELPIVANEIEVC